MYLETSITTPCHKPEPHNLNSKNRENLQDLGCLNFVPNVLRFLSRQWKYFFSRLRVFSVCTFPLTSSYFMNLSI
jgi:hypothetical protein